MPVKTDDCPDTPFARDVVQPRRVGHGPTLFAGLSKRVDLKLVSGDVATAIPNSLIARQSPSKANYLRTSPVFSVVTSERPERTFQDEKSKEGRNQKGNWYMRNSNMTKSCTRVALLLALSGLIVFVVSIWASPIPVGPSTVQGDVKDSKGQAVAGAELQIRAKDGSGFYRIVHTNANGHYGVSKLPNTDYEVILFLNGSIKALINNTKTFADKPTQLDFKLNGQYAGTKTRKHTHMVYVPAETGSHLGGRWVEVDDNSDVAAAAAGANNLTRVGNAAVRAVQSNAAVGPHPNGGEAFGR